MNPALLPLMVAVPFISAALLVLIRRQTQLRHAILIGTAIASTVAGGALLYATRDGEAYAHLIAEWQFGISIPFVVDTFSALMITVISLLTIVCSFFAISSGEASRHYFSPFALLLLAGVNGAVLTADLFNLFVFIEVMLVPSYGLIAMLGGNRRIRGARVFVTVNLLASTLLLSTIGLVYGVTGSVNIAEVAGTASESTRAAIAGAGVLISLGIKAALVPVHGWLNQSYPTTSPAVTALFSGIHTKVALYAIYRVYAVMFDGDARFLWIGVLIASLTMLIGVFAAVGENTTRSILTHHMVSQIGYIFLGMALFSPFGLAASIFYLVQHSIVKASLFLSTGAIEIRYGTGSLSRLGGIARREPLIAVTFMFGAMSLAGLPPFSGFAAKVTLLLAAVEQDQFIAAAVAILVSLLTLLSMLKIWGGVFGGGPSERVTERAKALGASDESPRLISTSLALPSLFLGLISISFGLGAQTLFSVAERAASGLIDPMTYIQAVIGA